MTGFGKISQKGSSKVVFFLPACCAGHGGCRPPNLEAVAEAPCPKLVAKGPGGVPCFPILLPLVSGAPGLNWLQGGALFPYTITACFQYTRELNWLQGD